MTTLYRAHCTHQGVIYQEWEIVSETDKTYTVCAKGGKMRKMHKDCKDPFARFTKGAALKDLEVRLIRAQQRECFRPWMRGTNFSKLFAYLRMEKAKIEAVK